MRVAILGANSQLSQDYIETLLSIESNKELFLFSRNPIDLGKKICSSPKFYRSYDYEKFHSYRYDVIINFVGAGDPQKVNELGREIFSITNMYDSLAVEYIKRYPTVKYIFISSGAAYGNIFFNGPASEDSIYDLAPSDFRDSDYYGKAKYFTEQRHRSYNYLNIIDLRVFSYFSKRQKTNSSFLVVNLINAIKSNRVFETSMDNLWRDYIGANDFYNLLNCIVQAKEANVSLDCFTKAPVDKISLLNIFKENFSLNFKFSEFQKLDIQPNSRKYYFSLKRNYLTSIGYQPTLSSTDLLLSVAKNHI